MSELPNIFLVATVILSPLIIVGVLSLVAWKKGMFNLGVKKHA